MILAAFAPAFVAVALFFGSIRSKRRGLTEEQCRAASFRLFDGQRVNALVFFLLAWSLLVIAAVHLITGYTNWLPRELS